MTSARFKKEEHPKKKGENCFVELNPQEKKTRGVGLRMSSATSGEEKEKKKTRGASRCNIGFFLREKGERVPPLS